jgi:glycine C-acetyltransferase/8-amino-7-oxononanoate synthase
MNIWKDMQEKLGELEAADLLRTPAVVDSPCGPWITVGGRQVVCLCSNDYLGLANDPAIKAAAIEAIHKQGVGAGASRLVSGTHALHTQLESRLAQFKHTAAAIVTPSGWTANQVAIHALAGAGDLIVCDKLNHASILDAALSGGARVRTYTHRDVARLKSLLDRHRAEHRRCLIVTDSLFSMDGDLAPLAEIAQLKARFDAQLLIDEAHATGVLGQGGRGAAELLGVEDQVDATVGTLSKAIGALGGFVAGPKVLIDTIRNTGRAFIYTTALPPALCAAAIKALDIIHDEPNRRRHLLTLAGDLREQLAGATAALSAAVQPVPRASLPALQDYPADRRDACPTNADRRDACPTTVTQIIPIIVGQAGRARELSDALLAEGFFVPAIRPPTVPKGTSRLRVSLSAAHRQEDLQRFARTLKTLLDRIR